MINNSVFFKETFDFAFDSFSTSALSLSLSYFIPFPVIIMSRDQLLLTEDEKIRGTDTQGRSQVVLQNVEDDRKQTLLSKFKA